LLLFRSRLRPHARAHSISTQDYIGLDTIHAIIDGWKRMYPNEPAFVMPKCLEEMVKAGKLGRKSGEGFYKWSGNKKL
jgi:3-hydroxyacyl-CoA dehydrogenase